MCLTENTVVHESIQLTHKNLVQAELSLRYWREHQNLYVWAPIPLVTCRSDYRSLELALIQEWQPRLNYPFICQFFHPKKGPLKRPAMNTNAKFGLATLWRRARHSIHTTGGQGHLGIRSVPKPSSTVAYHS